MMDKSQIPFVEWAKSVQARLNFEYESSRSILTHGTVIGAIREAVVRNILRKFLPPSSVIGTGQVIDSRGVISNQIDIVISRGDLPIFQFDGDMSAFLFESVLATVEVKSMLYRDKLLESLENSCSVKQLTFELEFSTSKGMQVFDEALKFIDSIGGIEKYDERITELDLKRCFGVSYELTQVLPFAAYWLHWSKGDFTNQAKIAEFLKLEYFTGNDNFDFFGHLLQFVLKQPDSTMLLNHDFEKAEEIKQEFFNKLYEYLLVDSLPPNTLVLAYGGYESIENMVSEVQNWYDAHKDKVPWYDLPKVIMNHKMFMYRSYNVYYCAVFDYPILWLAFSICSLLTRQLLIPVGVGAVAGPDIYFFLTEQELGNAHPKNSSSSLTWTIPLDNSSAGEIKKPNMITESPSKTSVVQQQHKHKTKKKKGAHK